MTYKKSLKLAWVRYHKMGVCQYIVYDKATEYNGPDFLSPDERYFVTTDEGLDNYFSGIEPIQAIG